MGLVVTIPQFAPRSVKLGRLNLTIMEPLLTDAVGPLLSFAAMSSISVKPLPLVGPGLTLPFNQPP